MRSPDHPAEGQRHEAALLLIMPPDIQPAVMFGNSVKNAAPVSLGLTSAVLTRRPARY